MNRKVKAQSERNGQISASLASYIPPTSVNFNKTAFRRLDYRKKPFKFVFYKFKSFTNFEIWNADDHRCRRFFT